jgi:cytochrome c553
LQDRLRTIVAGVALAASASGATAEETPAGDPAAGETRYNVNCVNCHGKAGQGMASFPALQGREAAYIAEKLETYRAREMVGPNSAIMMSLAQDLSDADIANLAAFIADRFQ